jgi:hypothetical protein
MSRTPPPTVLVLGWCCFVFGVPYLGWLLLYHAGNMVDMLAAALGSAEAVDSLLAHHLAETHAVMLTFLTVCLEAVLLALLLACGYGLLHRSGWARWSTLFFAGVVVPVALAHSVLHLLWLTLPHQPIRVTPLIMDAIVIQFAIVLGGSMFMPSVTAAFQPEPEVRTPAENERPRS